MPLRLKVNDIAFFERPLVFARPFRFGAVTITASTQLFVRVEIEVEGKGRATGASAEMLAPKWFDKRPHLTEEQSLDGLRRSLAIARELYLANRSFETAFGLHASCIGPQVAACAAEDIPPLAAGFGPAEIDKAILDALLRAAGANFFDGMIGNIADIDARLTPDLDNAAIARFLATRKRLDRVAVRIAHRVIEDAVFLARQRPGRFRLEFISVGHVLLASIKAMTQPPAREAPFDRSRWRGSGRAQKGVVRRAIMPGFRADQQDAHSDIGAPRLAHTSRERAPASREIGECRRYIPPSIIFLRLSSPA